MIESQRHEQQLEFLDLRSAASSSEYRDAVLRLLPLARGDSGGSKPAAMVLLSAYNGYDFSVSIPDLSLLDPANFHAALTIIKSRCHGGSYEPHEVIENGSEIFRDLAEQWAHLNISRQEAAER